MSKIRDPRPTGFLMDVILLDVTAPVWRRMEVPAKLRMTRFHDAIQIAMGWQDEHLFEFQWGPYIISTGLNEDVYEDEPTDRLLDAADVTMAKLGLRDDSMLTYVYDFGDHWVHAIRVKLPLYTPLPRPRVIAGEGACPPEDVGGVGGYEQFMEAWSDPMHPEHAEMVEWGTDWYTPGPFNVANADLRMAKRFRSGRAKAGPQQQEGAP